MRALGSTGEDRLSGAIVDERMQKLGFGFYQVFQLLLLAGVYFVNGSLAFLFASTVKSVGFFSLPISTRLMVVSSSLGVRSLGIFL